jgi:hypothetical protein
MGNIDLWRRKQYVVAMEVFPYRGGRAILKTWKRFRADFGNTAWAEARGEGDGRERILGRMKKGLWGIGKRGME